MARQAASELERKSEGGVEMESKYRERGMLKSSQTDGERDIHKTNKQRVSKERQAKGTQSPATDRQTDRQTQTDNETDPGRQGSI